MRVQFDPSGVYGHHSSRSIKDEIAVRSQWISTVLKGDFAPADQLGWFSPSRWIESAPLDKIHTLAREIRESTDVFLLDGVGGSNRGAQSVIEALGDGRVQILYTGTNLSSQMLQKTLAALPGKNVFLNVIAKDFNTLEPGIHFRLLRQALEKSYGENAARRILVTGSPGVGQLIELSQRYGYEYLPFPEDMGGRFSVLSAVGLLPMAVAGIDIERILEGAIRCETFLKAVPPEDNPAVQYAAARNLLYDQGFFIENMVTFEPDLVYFARWWAQLFGESEGKNQRCIFPTFSSYSEDLHALGQYIQDGKRMVMETFLNARFSHPEIIIPPSEKADGFDYLNGKSFDALNAAVVEAAYTAHQEGGVPCFQFHCGEINAEVFGELFYFFMLSACLSAQWIGVNPFGQNGVEAYKKRMVRLLGK